MGLPNVRTTQATGGHEPGFFRINTSQGLAGTPLGPTIREYEMNILNCRTNIYIYMYYNARIFLANTNLNMVTDLRRVVELE